MATITNEDLINEAKRAKEASYSPYSQFPVGAALLTEDGTIITGCNIENASYGATMCAERTAIFKAVSMGYKKFKKIAVVGKDSEQAYPCGMCLQVLSEFAPDITVLLSEDNKIYTYSLIELLPHMFTLS